MIKVKFLYYRLSNISFEVKGIYVINPKVTTKVIKQRVLTNKPTRG